MLDLRWKVALICTSSLLLFGVACSDDTGSGERGTESGGEDVVEDARSVDGGDDGSVSDGGDQLDGTSDDTTAADTSDSPDDTSGVEETRDDASDGADADGGNCGTDQGCPCDYKATSEGVCGDATYDGNGTCQEPETYQSPEETCDDLDNDCDGDTDEECDKDGDDYCDGSLTTQGNPSVCPEGGGDCADLDSTRNPGESEICDDGTDNDCDGDTDCDDSDCQSASVCNNNVETQCGDGVDNDSDGDTDCDDIDCANESCGRNETCCPPILGGSNMGSGICNGAGQRCPQ